MTDEDIRAMLLRALNKGSVTAFDDLDLNASVEDLGLDSLGLSEMILFIEEATGNEIPGEVLDKLAGVQSMKLFYELLSEHFVGTSA